MKIKKIKCRIKETGEEFFLPMIETDTDYQWQLSALRSRIEHPEWYEKDEDVKSEIRKIRKWLSENSQTTIKKEQYSV